MKVFLASSPVNLNTHIKKLNDSVTLKKDRRTLQTAKTASPSEDQAEQGADENEDLVEHG